MIIQSLLFATKKHEGQTRIGGTPYIQHPIRVAEILEKKGFMDERYLKTALFHDLLEDTDATEQEVYHYGGKDVLTAVKALTKYKGYVMEEYIAIIKQNFIAKMVKLADRIDNLNSAVVTNKAFKERYITETELYYVDLAKGTVFESDLKVALSELKKSVICNK